MMKSNRIPLAIRGFFYRLECFKPASKKKEGFLSAGRKLLESALGAFLTIPHSIKIWLKIF